MRRCMVALGALAVLLLSSGPALADPPVRVTDQVTDPAGVLGPALPEIRSTLQRLHDQDGINLYVVLVSGFDEPGHSDWATASATRSKLKASDMLVAIDVDSQSYEYWVANSFPAPSSTIDNVFVTQVEPLLPTGAWAGALIALTDGLSNGSSHTFLDGPAPATPWSGTTGALVGAVVLVTLGGAHLLSRRGTSTPAG